jgi:hypothetical protein
VLQLTQLNTATLGGPGSARTAAGVIACDAHTTDSIRLVSCDDALAVSVPAGSATRHVIPPILRATRFTILRTPAESSELLMRVRAVVIVSLNPGKLTVIIEPGAGHLDGGIRVEVSAEAIPVALRIPNTALWLDVDAAGQPLAAWPRAADE